MHLSGPTTAFTAPGQFANVRLAGFYLRRPFSVFRWNENGFEIIYKILGEGTAQMAQFAPGTELDVLVGLGNGFSPEKAAGKRTVLIGGGVGVPPLYALAAHLAAGGEAPVVALGFAGSEDIFLKEEFEALGCTVVIATEDGGTGVQGYVTEALAPLDYNYYFACGPQAMLRAVYLLGADKGAEGQLSFEERMGCGFGACMGCSCKVITGSKRICMEGPVLESGEVMFS